MIDIINCVGKYFYLWSMKLLISTITTILLMVQATLATSQNVIGTLNNASSNALGGVSSSFADVRGLAANPASIASIKNMQALIFADQRFGIKELSAFSAGIALPTHSGSFGLSLGRFGFDLYNENLISASYGRKLFANLSVGGSIQYQYFNIPDYGKKGVVGFQLGLYSELNRRISLFFSVSNPGRQKITDNDHLSGIFKVGAMYIPNDRLAIRGEFCKTLEHSEDFRFGVEYAPSSRVIIRVGGQTAPAQFGVGFGIVVLETLVVEASAKYDPQIGYHPGVGLSYGIAFDHKKKL